MISLHRIAIENYLSLQHVNVTLDHLNVLVGPNGAGKSNFLDAIEFLGDMARYDLVPAFDMRGGFDSCHFRGLAPDKKRQQLFGMSFEIEAVVTTYAHEAARDVYSILIATEGPHIGRLEEFQFKRTKGAGRRIKVKGTRIEVIDDQRKASKRTQSVSEGSAALSTLQRLGEDMGATQVRELASLFQTFRVFNVDIDAARRPSEVTRSPVLAANASNLAAFLKWLSDEHEDTFQLLQEDLRYMLPGFSHIVFRPIGGAAEAVALELVEKPLSGTTPLRYASFGTIRALALLAMLHDPNPPRLTCVEEIDHGLHPYALDRIVERLRSASRRTQLLVATHSPALVNRLAPEELIVCERDPETGASRIPAIDPQTVREMASEDELRLGELWFSGALGGVP